MQLINIAIDGPAGSGKGTVSRLVAKELSLKYLDSGALYRGIAYYLNSNNLDLKNVELNSLSLQFDFIDEDLYLEEENIEKEIRTNQISELASYYSSFPKIREYVNSIIKQKIKLGGFVLEGRDIGSVVMPDAEVKIYLDANPEIRARRRLKDYQDKGQDLSYDKVLEDINKRDKRDSTRKDSPLTIAKDAKVIDSTNMSIDEVKNKIIEIARNSIS